MNTKQRCGNVDLFTRLTGEEKSKLNASRSLTDEKLVLKSGSGNVILSGLDVNT